MTAESATKGPAGAKPVRAKGVPIALQILLVGLVVGLIARVICLILAPTYSYVADHVDNMAWSQYAVDHGPWALYDMPVGQPLIIANSRSDRNAPGARPILSPHAYNYPPGSAYLFWLQGLTWNALDSKLLTVQLTGDAAQPAIRAGRQPVIRSRQLETLASRFADALPALLFDLLLAWGVARLVRELRPSPVIESLAAVLIYLAPPVFLDSSFWTHADAWIAAPLVWTIVLVLRERLFWAGVIFGLGLTLKPQGILLLPVLAFIFFARRFGEGGSWIRALAMAKMLGGAAAAVAVIVIPFMARDQAKGFEATRWFERSYTETIGAKSYAFTTLNAFNLWGFDAAVRARAGATPRQVLDLNVPLLGLSRKHWGTVALGACILGVWALCAFRRRWTRIGWVECAFAITFAAFLLPTGVHERYVYYCIPFAIALMCVRPLWTPVALILTVVGGFEMVSFWWKWPIASTGTDLTLALSAASVFAMVYALCLLALRPTGVATKAA